MGGGGGGGVYKIVNGGTAAKLHRTHLRADGEISQSGDPRMPQKWKQDLYSKRPDGSKDQSSGLQYVPSVASSIFQSTGVSEGSGARRVRHTW